MALPKISAWISWVPENRIRFCKYCKVSVSEMQLWYEQNYYKCYLFSFDSILFVEILRKILRSYIYNNKDRTFKSKLLMVHDSKSITNNISCELCITGWMTKILFRERPGMKKTPPPKKK